MPVSPKKVYQRGRSRRPFHVETPLIVSRELSDLLGTTVLLKLENLQPSGSFKLRGIGRTVQKAVEGGARRLVGCSGGNAGLAMAYAAERTGAQLTLFIPRSTKPMMARQLKKYDIDLHVVGKDLKAARAKAKEFMVKQKNAFFVHPFEQRTTWAGNATMVREIRRQLARIYGQENGAVRPAAFVTAVGGGGLAMGLVRGMSRAGWSSVPLVAMETRGCECFNKSLLAGRPVELAEISTIATSLGCSYCVPELVEAASARPVVSRVATDRQALEACLRFANDHRMLVEPACGAALAAVYFATRLDLAGTLGVGKRRNLKGGRALSANPVVVIVCGGTMASFEVFDEWKKQLGMK